MRTEPHAKGAEGAKESIELVSSSAVLAHLLVKILVSQNSQPLSVLCALGVSLLGLYSVGEERAQ